MNNHIKLEIPVKMRSHQILLLAAVVLLPSFVHAAPSLIVSSPKAHATLTNGLLMASGNAKGTVPITNVYYSFNGLAWASAVGTTNWSVPDLVLTPGANSFWAYAVDESGATSRTNKITFTYVPNSISIVSVSSKSPNPLTPITVTVAGLTNGIPISLIFSNKAGFFFSNAPIRMDSSNTAIVAVPLYMNPKTQAVAKGTVSLVVIQGDQVSKPVSISIQELPALKTYGAQLGQISHTFFVLQTLLLGGQLNQLQAAQLLIPSVDTTQSQQTVSNLLQSAILARNDVDAIMQNNSTVFTNGFLPDGTPILFDQNALELMDRILAVHLTGLASIGGYSNSPQALITPKLLENAASVPENLDFIFKLVGEVSGVGEVVKSAQDASQSQALFDQATALVGGLNSLVSLNDLSKNASLVSEKLGASLSVVAVIQDVTLMSIDLGFIIKESYFGNDNPDVLQAAYADINNHQTKTFHDSALTLLAVPGVYLAEVGEAATAWQVAGGTAAKIVQTCITTYDIFDSAEGQSLVDSAIQVGGNINIFPSPDQGFAQITGTVVGGTGSGETAPQSSLTLCCFGAAGLGIQGICDPSGNFDLFVPLDVSDTDYGNLSLSGGDFITGELWGSTTVDLAGVDTTTPVQIPTFINTNQSGVFTLNLGTTGTGTGSVSANPPGPTYTNGTIVTLTAVPAQGSEFAGWSGDASGTASAVKITMNANESVTATFNLKQTSGGVAGTWSLTTEGSTVEVATLTVGANGTFTGSGWYFLDEENNSYPISITNGKMIANGSMSFDVSGSGGGITLSGSGTGTLVEALAASGSVTFNYNSSLGPDTITVDWVAAHNP